MRGYLSIFLFALLLSACATPPPATNTAALDGQCEGFGYAQGGKDFSNCLHMLDLLSGHP